jgi:hypothetical protein
MFKEAEGSGQPYPATEEERDTLISQVLDLIHTEETSNSLVKFMKNAGESPIEPIAKMASQITAKTVKSIENQTKRDVPGDTELAILSMATEELATIATQFGANFTPEMIQNSVQIGAQMFNQMMGQMQEGQRGQQEAPQNPSALGGMV